MPEFNLEKVTKQLEDKRKSLIVMLKKSVNDADKMLSTATMRKRGYESYPLAVVQLAKRIFEIEATIDAKKEQAKQVAENIKNMPKQPYKQCSCERPNNPIAS